MLTISNPLIGIEKADYYLELAREDYYLHGGEPPGRWHGGAAKLLELRPKVEKAAFRNLLAGFTPDGKTPCVQNAGDPERQSGWDFTFSPPKSVSVLWSQAKPEVRRQIEQAHQEAVRTALDYLEAVGGITRRGKGGKIREATPLLFALFEHGTSREQDPQPHTHAILLNLAFRSDGTTGSLVTRELFRHKMAAGALYRAALAKGLVKSLPLEIEPSHDNFEIKGVPKALCDTFSKRRKQIKKLMAERGLTSAIDAKQAALDTRRKKAYIPRKQLFEAWQEVGRQHGWSTPQVEELLQRAKTVAASPEKPVVNQLFQEIPRRFPQPDREFVRRAVEDYTAAGGKRAERAWVPAYQREEESFLGFVVRYRWAFRDAPRWSPVRNLIFPYLAVKWWPRKKRFGRIHAQVKVPFRTIQLRQRMLLPAAPQWSPVHGLSLPAIVVFKNRRPPPRPPKPRIEREREIHR